ncbi:unnamed protein product [Ixodes pacificus]
MDIFPEANNKYLPDYDPTKPSNYLMYLDANPLYGWALSQPLPYDDFEFIDHHEFLSKEHGYILELDLRYPNKQ